MVHEKVYEKNPIDWRIGSTKQLHRPFTPLSLNVNFSDFCIDTPTSENIVDNNPSTNHIS